MQDDLDDLLIPSQLEKMISEQDFKTNKPSTKSKR